MLDHRIIVTFDGNKFTYKDELTGENGPATHVMKHHTIVWKLSYTGPKSNPAVGLRILFNKSGSPFGQTEFDGRVGTDTNPVAQFANPKKQVYDYTAVAVLKNGIEKSDDPQIIFQDYPLDTDLTLVSESLDMLGSSAQSAFRGLLADLKDTVGLKRDPNGLFFPGGINNLSVQITVLGVPVNITVSGPPATALFSTTEAKA